MKYHINNPILQSHALIQDFESLFYIWNIFSIYHNNIIIVQPFIYQVVLCSWFPLQRVSWDLELLYSSSSVSSLSRLQCTYSLMRGRRACATQLNHRHLIDDWCCWLESLDSTITLIWHLSAPCLCLAVCSLRAFWKSGQASEGVNEGLTCCRAPRQVARCVSRAAWPSSSRQTPQGPKSDGSPATPEGQ